MNRILRAVRTALVRLERDRARALRAGAAEEGAPLCDNYLLLRQALSGAARFCRRARGSVPAALWEDCLGYLSGTPQPDKTNAAACFGSPGLTLSGAAALGVLLPAAAAALGTRTGGYRRATEQFFCLREIDFESLFPFVCPAERVLLEDVAYRLSDAETKAVCRLALVKAAEKRGERESALAHALVRQPGGVFASLPPKKSKIAGVVLLSAETLLPLLIGAAFGAWACSRAQGIWSGPPGAVLFCALLYLPLLAAFRPLMQTLAERLRKPYFLPSLDGENPDVTLPRVLITVSSLLPAARDAAAFADRLRRLYASHTGSPAAVLALLDPPNASVPVLPADRADAEAMRREIQKLNDVHGGGFVLAVRGRVFSPTENEYTGYERKRGAFEALVRLLRDGADGFDTVYGDIGALKDVRYLLALDADTELPFESLRRLLCTAWHPANRAVLDPRTGRLAAGYGCFAPRTEVSSAAASATRFARILSWGGVSAYAPRVSARYMDLFGTSVFCGKGLIDVDVFRSQVCGVLPSGRVLSHDVPEGGLLRTAFVSSVVFTEGFPASPASFFRRQDRWVRGDVQNLPFLCRTLPGGRKLPLLTKYQLLDNVLRALTPAGCLAALLCSVCVPAAVSLPLFVSALLGTAGASLLNALRIFLRDGAFGFTRVYFSACLSAGARALLRAVLDVAFLPYGASVNLLAAARGVFRMLSKRRTLEWTTAADAEKRRSKHVLFPVIVPFLCALVLSYGHVWDFVPAVLILLLAPFAVSDGRRRKRKTQRLTDGEADALRQYAAAMWRYFETYAGPEDRFLPPDNVQETPVPRVAHRTSPTNIGLYLLCVLAAADLSLISAKELSDRLEQSFASVLRLRRFQGLLFNWYDTRTLQPLEPAFLSSVDCGNYLVCLTALKEGLKEYLPLGFAFAKLIRDVEYELENARIELLYVPRRRLFSVGLQLSAGKHAGAYYDSYMSEARLTSYYACAKRLVPAAHWATLDRSFLRRGRRTAAASYGGTAFEYLMPALFLPLYENTYALEGLRGCVWMQKRRVRGTGRPWGVSESGYYAFDETLDYRYRAHGLRSLSLRRDPNDEPVFAPYVSFLSLPVDAHAALGNLKRFASLGAYGACGFYEAADFSARTLREDYMLVRSYMAHHVGMSLLAAVNALRDGLFVRRFTRDAQMESALSLLAERIPADAPVHRSFAHDAKKRPPRPRVPRLPAAPADVAAFSNGEATLLCSTAGANRVLYGRCALLRFTKRAPGVSAAVFPGDGTILRFPGGRLTGTCYYAKTETPGLTAETALALVDRFSALAVPVKLKNRSSSPCTLGVGYYLEPLLQPLFGESEHPAFADMGLRIVYNARAAALLITRVSHGRAQVSFAVGFSDFSPFSFGCDRERFFGDPFLSFPDALQNGTDFAFPCVSVLTSVRLETDAKTEKVLLLCPAGDPDAALEALSRLRRTRLPDLRRAVRQAFPPGTAVYARRFLHTVCFGAADPDIAANASQNTAPHTALWEQGISGDVPVLRVRADGLPPDVLRAFTRFHRCLLFCGIPADLVFLTARPAEYRGAALEELRRAAGVGAEQTGRVRALSEENCSRAFLSALSAAPGLSFPFSDAPVVPAQELPQPLPCVPLVQGENTFVPHGYFIGARPPRVWSHTLSNRVFGTLVTWGSLGFTWAYNARLNPLTPWHNDPSCPFDGETLLLHTGGRTYDCVFGASAYFTDDAARFGGVCGGVKVRVTVQTDAVAAKKRVLVRWDGAGTGDTLVYRVRPLLCDSPRRAGYLNAAVAPGRMYASNPANVNHRGVMCLCADLPCAAAFAAGTGTLTLPLTEGAGEVRFDMVFAASKAAADALTDLPFVPPVPKRVSVPHPDPAVSRFAGALLLHNVCDTRMLARTGFYQCGGAYGFRDQLQDAMNVVRFYPDLAKTQILRCAAAQFPQGDVLHWFHTVTSPATHRKGVRTRCSDDFLWLPLAVCEYVSVTGDVSLLHTELPYLQGEELAETERERYADYGSGRQKEPLYLHCLRALKRSFRFGAHALPLMLGGDWNDAFGEVGAAGAGESVWLGMLQVIALEQFAPLARGCGDDKTAAELEQLAADLRLVLSNTAYRGGYFLRGYYDDGTPLGAPGNGPCQIDLLPQAFAVFAGIGTHAERLSALKTALEKLYDQEHALLRLFAPPFAEPSPRAGYVNDYPPGVRENAGQYTHAAVWFCMALRQEGLTKEADALLPALIPALRYSDPALAKAFGNEPYAVTADVSAAPAVPGRGGWSLYTGAAGWLLRLLRGEPWGSGGMKNEE